MESLKFILVLSTRLSDCSSISSTDLVLSRTSMFVVLLEDVATVVAKGRTTLEWFEGARAQGWVTKVSADTLFVVWRGPGISVESVRPGQIKACPRGRGAGRRILTPQTVVRKK